MEDISEHFVGTVTYYSGLSNMLHNSYHVTELL
jgi:hypothetical protein